MDPAPLGGVQRPDRIQEGGRMTVIEALLFGTVVQLSAGVVVVINVVMSRLEQANAEQNGGR